MTDSELTLRGTGVTPLAGVGSAYWYDPGADLSLPEPTAVEDPAAERERFEAARADARAELETERDETAERIGESEADVFGAHLQFLNDPQITDGVESAIEDDGLPAEHAVERAFADGIEQLQAAGGMMAERTDDLRDVRDRLLRLLLDASRASLADVPEGTVVLAERLTPSDTAQIDPDRIAAFATVEGGRTSHAAIMARSLGLPSVVGVGEGLRDVADGVTVLVDGETGEVVVNPSDERREAAATARDVDVIDEPVATADGREIEVAGNLGAPAEASRAVEHGADGVGLFRTEFLFLDRDAPPDEDEQYEAFVEVLEAFEGGRVVVRTLDVGGDKSVPYLDEEAGDNPFLGVRGVRLAPGVREDLFETQVRALLRAAASERGDGLAVMFPLVATVEELEDALERVDDVAAALEAEGVEHAMPELGVMVETPASAFVAEELAERVDFLSIGTNDLTQYVMAAARDDERVSHLHDPTYPAVLRAIRRTVEGAHRSDAWVGMCGEMAGDPDLTELLVGLGLDEFSMSAVTIPAVKANVRTVDAAEAEALAADALAASTRAEVREVLGLEEVAD